MYKLLDHIKPSYNPKLKIYNKLFDSLIEPILIYNSEIWGISDLKSNSLSLQSIWFDIIENNKFNKVHLKFCKKILQVSKCSMNLPCLMELGRYPLIINQITRTVKFYLRIRNIINDPLLQNALYVHEELSTNFLTMIK